MSSAETGGSLADTPHPTGGSLADTPHPTGGSLADTPHPTGGSPTNSPDKAGEPLAAVSSPANSSGPSRRERRRRSGDLTAWLSLGLAGVATLATLPLIWTPIRLQEYRSAMHPEWHLYLVGAQLLALPFFLLIGGLPRTLRAWLIFLAANLEMAVLACLSALDLLNLATVHVLVLGLRGAILFLWLFVVIGLGVAIWRLINRPRGSVLRVSTLGKLWFSALVFLVVAEPCAALLARGLGNPNRLGLPKNLPPPPPDELHVAFVGESTMAGFPYMKFGIPKVVGWQLSQMYPNQKIVLDDVSAVGLNLRTALDRLDRLTVRPQLLFLYSGHNEFFYDVEELATDLHTPWERFDRLFEWSPLFRVLDQRISRHIGVQDLEAQGTRTLVDRPIASPEAREKRLARFGGQLEELARWCERLEVCPLWFVPAGTEADYAPNRSYLNHTPSDADRAEIESIERQALTLENAKHWKEAGDKFQAALERYPEFAEFHFQLAECMMHQGLPKQARPHYDQALNLDGLPIRMTRAWQNQVKEVADQHNIITIDAAQTLLPHCPAGILDRSVFLDYVHPNLRGYYDLGMEAVVQALKSQRNSLQSRVSDAHSPSHTDFASAIAWAGFTAKDLALAYRRTAEADRLMSRLRFESSRLTRDAKQYEDWSRRLEAGQIAPGQDGTEALK